MKTKVIGGGSVSTTWTSILNNPFENFEPSDFLPATYDFNQFVLLNGRQGGQTIYGGTQTSDTLKLFGNPVDGVNAKVYFTSNLKYYVSQNDGLFAPWVNAYYGVLAYNYKSNSSVNSDIWVHTGVNKGVYFYQTYAKTNEFANITPSGIQLGGLSNYYIKNGRNTSSVDYSGFHLEVEAGGSTVTRTNGSGGTLFLKGGKSTGTGFSSIIIQPSVAGESGAADNSFINVLEVNGAAATGKIGFFGATPASQQQMNSFASQTLLYDITTPQLVDYINILTDVILDLRDKIGKTTLIINH